MKITVIQKKIFELRGEKVMLDVDLAALYGVETRIINQAIKRNKDRFPKDFMFRLTATEWKNLRSQFVISSHGGRRYPPYAFTEHGVTMLANVLTSKKAVKMSIAVVRAFISLKKLAINQSDLGKKLEDLRQELSERIGEHDTQLNAIYEALENLLDEKSEERDWKDRERIGFKR